MASKARGERDVGNVPRNRQCVPRFCTKVEVGPVGASGLGGASEGARQPYAYGWRRRGRGGGWIECLNANASSIALYGQSLAEENVKEHAKVGSK